MIKLFNQYQRQFHFCKILPLASLMGTNVVQDMPYDIVFYLKALETIHSIDHLKRRSHSD
jgi:hypothetical protein